VERIHIVGILGKGMSALARLYHGVGYIVTGCDARAGLGDARAEIRGLARLGIAVTPSDAEHVQWCSHRFIYSSVLRDDHFELVAARRRGIPLQTRAEALVALLPQIADQCVAVSGVTGKSTVTALVAQMYRQLGARPSVYVGAEVEGLTDDHHPADSDRLAIIETCEVSGALHTISASVAAVTSIYWGEHPASYPDLASLEDAFARFAAATGHAVLPARYRQLAGDRPCTTFGTGHGADVRLCAYDPTPVGFSAEYRIGGERYPVETTVLGRHNADNLGAALACHVAAGTPPARLRAVEFRRLRLPRRRLELVGTVGQVAVFDDFGHNPVQIAVAARVLRARYPGGAIGAHFRPTGFGRLRAFGRQYVDSLQNFDWVRLAPPERNFEDTATTADETRFSHRVVAELRRRGVDARLRVLCPELLDDFADSGAVCCFGVVPASKSIGDLLSPRPGAGAPVLKGSAGMPVVPTQLKTLGNE
jgi:UDP-N-acetylmuramate--alanine ligase